MGGRRAKYTTRIAKRICEHIALGDTLKKALEKEPLAPSVTLFWRWIDEYPEFQAMYEKARQLQADLHADVIMEMAENVLKTPKFAAAYKVAADILRWQAEIRNPGRYGNKITVETKQTLDPAKLRSEIAQLEKEMKLISDESAIVDVTVREVQP